MIWRNCDGRTDVAGLARLVDRELGITSGAAVVYLALEQLASRHLLDGPVAPLSPEARRTRRDTLKKLVAVALLPVVMTITAKSAWANASLLTSCAPGLCNFDADCPRSTGRAVCFGGKGGAGGCTGRCINLPPNG